MTVADCTLRGASHTRSVVCGEAIAGSAASCNPFHCSEPRVDVSSLPGKPDLSATAAGKNSVSQPPTNVAVTLSDVRD